MATKQNALIEALFQIINASKVIGLQYSNHDNYVQCSYNVEECPRLLSQLFVVCSIVDCRFQFESKNGVINIEIQLK